MSLTDKIYADMVAVTAALEALRNIDTANAQLQKALEIIRPHLSEWSDIKAFADQVGGEFGAGLNALADRMRSMIDE